MVDFPIVGSFMGAAVGLTFRLTVVRLVPRVGDTPADLLVPRLTSGLAVGLIAPAPRPPRLRHRLAGQKPQQQRVDINFFIRNLPFRSVARQVVLANVVPDYTVRRIIYIHSQGWNYLEKSIRPPPAIPLLAQTQKKGRRIAPPALEQPFVLITASAPASMKRYGKFQWTRPPANCRCWLYRCHSPHRRHSLYHRYCRRRFHHRCCLCRHR